MWCLGAHAPPQIPKNHVCPRQQNRARFLGHRGHGRRLDQAGFLVGLQGPERRPLLLPQGFHLRVTLRVDRF